MLKEQTVSELRLYMSVRSLHLSSRWVALFRGSVRWRVLVSQLSRDVKPIPGNGYHRPGPETGLDQKVGFSKLRGFITETGIIIPLVEKRILV